MPPYYLITPEFTNDEAAFLNALNNSLKHGIRLVQFRCKQLAAEDYNALAKKVTQLVHQYQGTLLLNGAPELLQQIPADGIHLPSSELMRFNTRPLQRPFIISAACHNAKQLAHAQEIQADIALVSPILATPSCPTKPPLGWEQFASIIQNSTMNTYALGGLNPQDYPKAQSLGAKGIAGIRGLWDLKQNPLF